MTTATPKAITANVVNHGTDQRKVL